MTEAWWKEAVVYQIYPRSFADSNGDGIGDIRGIIDKLDYLRDLGVGVVWLSPVYRSPNDDNGYDISDYRDIDPDFGTLADWDEMVAGMHERGIKLVMDLVVNHSSDEHPWFVSARSSTSSPTRDYYIWRDGKDNAAPNNWSSFFGGSAWAFNEPTGDYYLHLFSKKQPDLNWENPELRRAIYDMMHWWLQRGVDGFRMDVINALSKVQSFPDAPNPDNKPHVFAPQFFMQGPRLTEFYDEMKREVLSHYDIMTVGEAALGTLDDALAVTHYETGALNMVFTFEHADVDMETNSFTTKWHAVPFDLGKLKAIMTRWQLALEETGWNSLYFNNHDQPRSVSRFGDDKALRRETATMLATCLHMMQGTPFVYQGEEIGMTNVAFDSIADYRDIESVNGYEELVEHQGFTPEVALKKVQFRSRDNARTPMQWNASPGAGFTQGTPWLKINPNHETINVATELSDPRSVLNYYKELIALRKQHPVMIYGRYDLVEDTDPSVYAFTREDHGTKLLVVCSFSLEPREFILPDTVPFEGHKVLLGNYPVDEDESPLHCKLRPFEARVYLRQAGATPHEQRVLAMTQEATGDQRSPAAGDEIEAGAEVRRETVTSGA